MERAPHSRDKNSPSQAFLSLPGWEGKVTPEPSHPLQVRAPELPRRMGNEQICAMELLHSITLTPRDGLELLQGSSPPRGNEELCPPRVNPGLWDTQSKANIEQHCGNESKSHSPPDFAPSAAPTGCFCLPRAAWAEFRKTQTQNLAAKG